MKNLLIIYPHWHPVNLAGVHRPRLAGNFMKEFGWQPIVLTVEQKYYEEKPDPDFERTFSQDFEVHRAGAFPITKPRIVGDIGLRAFFHLYQGAKNIIKSGSIDFIWIPIPSFYSALLGRLLYRQTKVAYGIDYIDPWVRDITGRNDWRHKLSNWLARILEPIAVKRAALITGVSYEYYKPVLERNFRYRKLLAVKEGSVQQLNQSTDLPINRSDDPPLYHIDFPYGFDPKDHQIKLENIQYPWSKENKVKPWIYAGAFLPNSSLLLKLFFEVIGEMRRSGKWDEQIRLYFIGTGGYQGKKIAEYANDNGIDDIVNEDRSRNPYLYVLNFLSAADTVMVLGSTEKHYTASKVYQALLSERPVWAVFHLQSSAVKVMEECQADQFLVRYKERMSEEDIKESIRQKLIERLKRDQWNPDLRALDKYSARESARKLVKGIETVLADAGINSA
jgi:hypothetical protein